jgi:hypothetical protein
MNDLLAHVNRSTIELERFFDGDHGTVNTGAITSWRS